MHTFIKRKFPNLLSDKKFSEILTGSVWALGARVIATGLGLTISVVVARFYGADMIGIIAMIQAFMMFATIITVMGTNTSILRLIPEHVSKYSVTSAFKVYRKTQYFVVALSLLASVGLYFLSDFIAGKIFGKPHLSFYFLLATWVVVFRSLIDLNSQAVRGLRMVKLYSVMQVLPGISILVSFIILTLLQVGRNCPVYAYMTGWVVTAIMGFWIMDFVFRQRMSANDVVHFMSLREILIVSAPMLMTTSMQFVIGQTGVVLLAIFRSDAEVGYYSVAVRLATLTSFVLQAINTIAAPKFAELYHKGALDELFHVAKKSSRLIFWTTTPILLVVLTFGVPILGGIFGREFTVAYPALVLLALGQFVNCISGSCGYFMNMTGHQIAFRNVMLIAATLNAGLSIILIPDFGIIGASVAGMLSLCFWNIYLIFYIKAKFGRSIIYLPNCILKRFGKWRS